MPLRPLTGLLLAAAGGLGGCLGWDTVPRDAVTRCEQDAIVPAAVQTDILFIVDNSASMAVEQGLLASAFSDFITQLSGSPVQNDFQIGITTTAVDLPACTRWDASHQCTSWELRTTYESGAPFEAGRLVAALVTPATPGTPEVRRPAILRAGSPTLVEDFMANVALGVSGPSKEQGLRAMAQALDGRNAGFLRPGAALAVVIVTDEDDCSDSGTDPQIIYSGADRCHSNADQALLPPVQGYVDLLRGSIGGQVRDVHLGIIAGVDASTGAPVQPACNADGYPAYRYRALADAFGQRAVVADVCQPGFTATLAAIAAMLDPGQTVSLSGVPADWRLLQVGLTRADGSQVSCRTGLSGAAAADTEAVYNPPQAGSPPRITFQGGCLLRPGDSIQIRVVCAG